jgi:Protein of unknown function (DUF1592)/Protein of unknown function (DUF1588)/Protein of unknown function (DUF1587)/Protein of unknown function (DUF1585)/Protein of unknown function (DUF1595)/Planctomycete cytochrome C
MRIRTAFLLALAAASYVWLSGLLPRTPNALPAAEPGPQKPDVSKVAGFLQKHCTHCHGEKVKRADLALHTYRDVSSLLRDRKRWQAVLKMVRSGEMPPPKRPRPTAAEVETFLRTVEGVYAQADQNAKPDPGRITVRRLNRAEYNNTIRDLVGIDFNPAEDFPSDDVGHGFDNIGDVLSVSPVLMERYLAAAESIAQRAILVDPPKPPVRRLASRWLEPASSQAIHWRPVPAKGAMLHTQWRVTLDGEYVFRARLYAESPDREPARISLTADGKELKTFEVTATKSKPAVFEAMLKLDPGNCRTAVVLLNPKAGEKTRNLFVEYLELTGPADTRPASHRRIMACTPGKSRAEQTREILTRLVSRAYRRPACGESDATAAHSSHRFARSSQTPRGEPAPRGGLHPTGAEVDRLIKLVEEVEGRGEKWEAGIRLALQAVLVSPKFLFRLELDDRPAGPDPRPLGDYQLASRLSYFLWSSMPDQELFDLAAKKALTANLDAQVRRMLKDPRARALVDNFAMQWLQLRRLKSVAPDGKLFPNFNERLRSAMLGETERFFGAIIEEDRGILDLIDADFTFLNEPLARHYGIIDTNGNRFRQKPTGPRGRPIRGEKFVRVGLSGHDRGGLLTQASVLTVTSNPTRTSPVKRGRWVLEQILGTPPPPPPPDVPELKEQAILTGSLRQRMEQHRANPSCANCHARMDPIGFAFENYDAIGAFRTKDGNFPIDPSGTLPDGKSFKGPAELKEILKGKKDLFARCLTEKLLVYALGRGLEYYDKPTVDRIVAALERNDYRFSTLVIEIARSDPFRLRRGTDKKAKEDGTADERR